MERWKDEDIRYRIANNRKQSKQKKDLLGEIQRKAWEHSFAVACRKKYSGQYAQCKLIIVFLLTSSMLCIIVSIFMMMLMMMAFYNLVQHCYLPPPPF